MTTDKGKVRSKIYTYFYGKSTVFQQFLIILGVIFILLTGAAQQAHRNGYIGKIEKLETALTKANEKYSELYEECITYGARWRVPSEPDKDDEGYKELRKLDDALEDLEKAESKLEKARSKGPGKGFLGILCIILGIASIAIGALWFLWRKLAYNTEGEAEYDAELAEITVNAKARAMQKIMTADPQAGVGEAIVLSGLADPRGEDVQIRTNFLAAWLYKVIVFILHFDKIIIGLVAAFIINAVVLFVSKNTFLFFIMLAAVCVGAVALGGVLYKKFEKESYVPQYEINRLIRFVPKLMIKLGGDDRVRASLPSVTVYVRGEDHLYVYYQYVDIVTGRVFCEGVREAFYEDIIGVSSEQDTKKIFKRCGFLYLFFKDVDYRVEEISVVTGGRTYNERYIVDMDTCLHDSPFIVTRNAVRNNKK